MRDFTWCYALALGLVALLTIAGRPRCRSPGADGGGLDSMRARAVRLVLP